MKTLHVLPLLALVAAAAALGYLTARIDLAQAAAAPAVLSLDGAPARGPARPKVTIIELGAYGSPQALDVERSLRRLEQTPDGIGLRVIWKDAPARDQPRAILAAEAAHAAGEQGRFWPMHDLLIAEPALPSRARLEQLAGRAGVELEPFRAALDSGRHRAGVLADAGAAERLGAGGGATLLIGGEKLVDPSAAALKAAVAAERVRADALLARGVAPSRLGVALSRER